MFKTSFYYTQKLRIMNVPMSQQAHSTRQNNSITTANRNQIYLQVDTRMSFMKVAKSLAE